ncbi:MAG: SoxR reducing system RseC family protein [Clostridiales bacterium]|nr:SoxR reducing system RseC family protein [Clostridiales bacterium]
MKTEEGLVLETTGTHAKIKVGKHSDCQDCGACPGNEAAIITARNPVGAVPGQRVQFELKESSALTGAFIVFVLPLAAIFAGAVLGGLVADMSGFDASLCRIVGGIAALALAVLFIKLFDKSVGKNENSLPVIVRILH